MTIKVKPVEQVKAKWTENAGRAGDAFATGALAAADEWASKTVAAKDNFKAAISVGNIGERFAAGVRKAGAATYTRKIQAVGQSRYQPGVQAATDDYGAGVQPYLDAIANVTLPGRKPRGDRTNYARVEAVGVALNAKRLAMLGMKA